MSEYRKKLGACLDMQPQLNELINPPPQFRYIATIPRNGKLIARKPTKFKSA